MPARAACSRLDYEGSVRIRDVKLACSRSGELPVKRPDAAPFRGKVAIIGAGPAGLSCAWYLSLWGAPVTVFEEAEGPGGVPAHVIPRFRITREDIASDIGRIASLGAEFRFGAPAPDLAALAAEGFTAVFVGAGAPVARQLALKGDGIERIDALSFLERCSAAEGAGLASPFAGRRDIAVAGGGNTAMDAVRMALRIPGVDKVSLVYRRTRAEMPADREETEAALSEGAALDELALPEAAAPGLLTLRRMVLGEPDASGRRSPLASDATSQLPCDLLVEALGEACDPALMARYGIPAGKDGRPLIDPETKAVVSSTLPGIAAKVHVGGDAARGPASIIAACADGKAAAWAMLRSGGVEPTDAAYVPPAPEASTLAARGKLAFSLEGEEGTPDHVIREAERCLECDSACLRCVEVCPNRANMAIPTGEGPAGHQAFQILHVDSLCNECGNCGFFCPWEGEPFRGKPALFATKASLEASHNAGFAIVAAGNGGAAARPGLAFRAIPDGPVLGLSYEEWAIPTSPGAGVPREANGDGRPRRHRPQGPSLSPRRPPMTLFEGVRIIDFSGPSVSGPCDVLVAAPGESGKAATILEVGAGLAARHPGAKRVRGACLSPGLVCSHTHLYSALARGMMVDIEPSKDFAQQLAHLWWRLDRAIDLPILEASGLAGLADAAMCGVTAVVDHHAGPEAIDGSLSVLAKAYGAIGLRGLVCYETTDRNGMEGARAGVRENIRFAKVVDAERKAGALPLVDGMIGGHAGFTLGEETLAALGDAVRSTGRGSHIHAGEDKYDAVDSRHRFGADLMARFDAAGLLTPRSVVGHGVWLTESEVGLVAERGSFLAHNARSNMNNAVGYNGLLHRHRNVVLGTDGMSADMLEEFRFACFRHRESGGPWWPGDFLACLDRGNRLLERSFTKADDYPAAFGKIEKGAAADLVLWDYEPPTPLEGANLAGHLAFGLSSRSVRSVMVDGRFVVEDRAPAFDAAAIGATARGEAARLWKRMEERR